MYIRGKFVFTETAAKRLAAVGGEIAFTRGAQPQVKGFQVPACYAGEFNYARQTADRVGQVWLCHE